MKKVILAICSVILFPVISWGQIYNNSLVPYADGKVSDTAYDATTWDGVFGISPSKNAVRDYLETKIPSTVSIPAGPSAGQITFTGPTQARSFALPDAAATVITTAYVPTEVGPTATTTATSTVDCGTVTAGDRILVMAFGQIAGTGITVPYIVFDKSAGSSTVVFQPQGGNGVTMVFGGSGTDAQGNVSTLVQVTGGGTLTLRATIGTTGGTGLSYPTNVIYGYFLKKQ